MFEPNSTTIMPSRALAMPVYSQQSSSNQASEGGFLPDKANSSDESECNYDRNGSLSAWSQPDSASYSMPALLLPAKKDLVGWPLHRIHIFLGGCLIVHFRG